MNEQDRAKKLAKRREHERRYGHRSGHRRLRADLARSVERGGVLCARCGLPIVPGTPFDLDHADDGRGYIGVSHAKCNRGASSRKRELLPAITKRSRDW